MRKPMRVEEADRLCNACKTAGEKFVLWTLLDTGLRVFELRCAD
jgi:integrase/recombinase XerD